MSTHDVADLAEESDHVAVLTAGAVRFTGTTADFLAHAPADAPPARLAEAAFGSLAPHVG
ncbi:hypothetical protein [Streptomyces amakusaensis]|uniref:ABC transporter ATP-binding protein n=1 Tax=Streptomyces amakusaensis TaxID=67271 RepID=A0ABW0AE96_9ACTN